MIFPNSQRMNRGGYEMSQLIHACRANDVTDFIVVHEHRGVPDSLVSFKKIQNLFPTLWVNNQNYFFAGNMSSSIWTYSIFYTVRGSDAP